MMHGRQGGFLNQETSKPKSAGQTLGRLVNILPHFGRGC